MKNTTIKLSAESLGKDFISKLDKLSGTPISHCFQCGKCTAGCPSASFMDYSPNKILRMLQMGQWKELLRSKSIWYCVSCETCSTRCPQKVHLSAINDALRKLSVEMGVASEESQVQLANKLFIESVRTYGRLYEMRLAAEFNLRSGRFFKDLALGPNMLSKGKLKLTHHTNRNIADIEKIFSRIEEMRKKGEVL